LGSLRRKPEKRGRQRPVILSGVAGSRSEAATQSKDPDAAGNSTGPARHSAAGPYRAMDERLAPSTEVWTGATQAQWLKSTTNNQEPTTDDASTKVRTWLRSPASLTGMATQSASPIAPQPDEYNPYYGRYISLVSSDHIVSTLAQQISATRQLFEQLSEKDGEFRYAPDKWSVKEVLGHVIDTERIFLYRALRIARNDKTPIEGYEQDDYVRYGPFHSSFG